MGCFARIEKLANGYAVEVEDPKVAAANAKTGAGWKDPCKEYAFKDLKSALKWIAENETNIASETDDAGAFTGAWNQAKAEEK